MKRSLVWLTILWAVCFVQFSSARPFDRVKPQVEKVVPDVFDVSIHLKGGTVVKVEKIGFSELGTSRRLSFRALDKTLYVMPTGATELLEIKTADIEKIEMVKRGEEPKPDVVPEPTI